MINILQPDRSTALVIYCPHVMPISSHRSDVAGCRQWCSLHMPWFWPTIYLRDTRADKDGKGHFFHCL